MEPRPRKPNSHVDRAHAEALARAWALVAHLRSYDSLSALAAVKLANVIVDADAYDETSHQGRAAYVEYVALLLFRGPLTGGQRVESSEDWGPITAAIDDLFMHAMLGSSLAAHADGRATDEVMSSVVSHELVVRNPAYRAHHERVLQGLFRPFSADMLRVVGFTIDDAVEIADTVSDFESDALNDVVQRSLRATEALQEPSLYYAKTGEWTHDYDPPQGYLDHIAGASRVDIQRALRTLAGGGASNAFADAQVHNIEEVAAASGVPLDRVQAFFDMTSLAPGDVPDDFLLPASVHPFMTRPYGRVGDDSVVAPTPGGVVPSLVRIVERLLKSDPKVWNRYQTHRHDYTLTTGLDLMKVLMPASTAEPELSYSFTDPSTGETVHGELDGLIEYDTALFLVETKGHTLDDASRRGAPLRLRKRLGEILRKSHAQALRARLFLEAEPTARFKRGDGSTLDVAGRDRRAYLVSLTLEPLGHVVGHLHSSNHNGVFADDDVPWAVCLYDLMVMADLLDVPAALPHYVERRLRVARQGVLEACDELDLFGHYLQNGLYYDESDLTVDGKRVDSVQVGSFTVPMDDYYLYTEGVRTRRAPKPMLKIDGKTRQLVRAIDESGLPGRLDAALSILDGAERARKAISEGITAGEKKAKRRGKPVRLAFDRTDARELLCFVVGLEGAPPDLRDRLFKRLRKDLVERDADHGVLVAFAAGSRKPLQIVTARSALKPLPPPVEDVLVSAPDVLPDASSR